MKVFTALLIFFSFILVFKCVPQPQDDYFDRIAMASDGRLTRFTELPVTVYVEGLDLQGKKYADDLRYALSEWEKCSDGMVKFQLASSTDGADIMVSWVRRLESYDQEHPLGVAELRRNDGGELRVEMRICTREQKFNRPLTHEQMRIVLLHEFGHAIGLWGHSKDKADVMYYAADTLSPTARDANTLKMLYSHEPDYSLHAQSIIAIREDMRSKPEDASLYFLLGTVYADQGNHMEAIDSFKKALHLDPEFHKAGIALASAYRASGQDQAALTEYLFLAESEPSAAVHNMIGALYFERNDAAKAIQHFKRSLEMERAYQPAKRNLYSVYVSRGKELISAKMYYAALALLLDGISFFPDSPELHNSLGTAYSETAQFREAISHYTRALRINPAFTPAKFNMASCYNNQGVKYAEAGQWKEAIEAYNHALRLMPDMSEANRNISTVYWKQASELSEAGKHEEAVKAYQRFLEREPGSKEAHNNLGTVYFRMGDYEAAIAEFKAALEIDPGDKGLRDNVAIAYHERGKKLLDSRAYSQAAEEFRKGLEYAPDKVSLHLSLAIAHQRLGRWDDAVRYVNEVLIMDPNSPAAREIMASLNIHQGNGCLESGEYDAALAYYSKVPPELMLSPLHNSIGYIYIMKGMYLEAVDEFDKVLEADPEDKTAHRNLVSIEMKLRQALARKPGLQQARDNLARVRLSLAMSHMGRGDLDKAKDALRLALDLKPQDEGLRRLLGEGCKRLAEALEERNARREMEELMHWAVQLR